MISKSLRNHAGEVMIKKSLLFLLMILITANFVSAREETNVAELNRLSKMYADRWNANQGDEYQRIISLTDGPWVNILADERYNFIGVTPEGDYLFHVYKNVNAAKTTRANTLHPGGISGYDVIGNESFGLAVWDTPVMTSHVEFQGRATSQDGGFPGEHGTHVAGTIVAGGIDSQAKGMAFGAYINTYSSGNDYSEMVSAAASGLKMSNHSYGPIAGYQWNGSWYWYGDVRESEVEDAKFGFYSQDARDYDIITSNAPFYTILVAAGNELGSGPSPGGSHYYRPNGTGTWTLSNAVREVNGGPDGYDCMDPDGGSKNILSVGSVNDVTLYNGPSSVTLSSFSSTGPSDDGRIKPDFVANGWQLYSTSNGGNTSYTTMGGTSMSTPNATGSLWLLLCLYEETHDYNPPRASTIKALAIHSADEAGPDDGPDYRFGWGLLNVHRGADVIDEDRRRLFPMQEIELDNSTTETFTYNSNGERPIRATISWTDPASTVRSLVLNDRTPYLVNDLDIRITDPNDVTYTPYTLDPDNYTAAAIPGDNVVDNTEMIYIEEPIAGEYTITVSHKGTLSGGSQWFSMILSGMYWADDPRRPVTNLASSLDFAEQTVELSWVLEGDLTDFEEFNVYRDGDLLGSTTDYTYTDNISEFDTYVYEVRSNWTLGESPENETTSVYFPEPVAPTYLSYSYEGGNNSDITLHWRQLRTKEISYDDDSSENEIALSDQFPAGCMIANMFTAESNGKVTALKYSLGESGSTPFGDVEFILYAALDNDDVTPGQELYNSGVVTPDEEGWYVLELNSPITFETGDNYWVGMKWIEAGFTQINNDTNSPYAARSSISIDASTWQPLEAIFNGFFEGNPLIRVDFGQDEIVAGPTGLVDFTVYRDGSVLESNLTEMYLDDTLPGTSVYTYTVKAVYYQGEMTSTEFEVDGENLLFVEEESLPTQFAINRIYPNPFNPSTTISISIPRVTELDLRVYNMLGQEVAKLAEGQYATGHQRFVFNASNMASGIYFVKASILGEATLIQKMLLVR
jgi:Subtilase family/Secretion system C-terminal sorting domain